ncbi:MAG: aminodeoxychorismate/anthranilate synthase component II [Candidatus Thermoplasmatota archaeon]|nr:aminodeoxychorismate/anthranilate synthase component II [Candidatus Sysuiplasma jiujiangense]MBX8638821.1 aminodeoxychorismate/anthranilate synthase component II [Candidatus Sysuiplasma jiujiangense]MBX8641105.1 aminodeoxychorismate/anthranilate synthase component II [Candidatus Sysuiplasma jiujiangense]MCL4317935.1 aminodeoxychorismate/anthranilate synthase component II [Candidatus Thermoplasmatota archaeon]MCL5253189.1 aminodeoxychorismate/anthranilate synthase component II [Candidatus The
MLLLIDNYDSFSYNLYQLLGEMGMDVSVERNDDLTLKSIRRIDPDAIVISPGPGIPSSRKYFGIGLQVIREMGKEIPVLGVCLGHQGIAYAYGGRVVHANRVMHGKTSLIYHEGSGLFESLPSPTTGGRYHSLIVEEETLPACIKVTARSEFGEIMALKHSKYEMYGIQFHPESILTPRGRQILKNFRKIVRGSL